MGVYGCVVVEVSVYGCAGVWRVGERTYGSVSVQ